MCTICRALSGRRHTKVCYRYGVVVKRKTVTDAVGLVDKNIEERLFSIQDKSGCIVKHIYIGKSFIEKGTLDFDPEQHSTWKLGGIHRRYKKHKENDYGKNGLMVVAVVTKDSILDDRVAADGYITNHEEYALMLEKRLIEKYREIYRPELWNKTTAPGKTDQKGSIGYVVYVAFALDPKREFCYNGAISYSSRANCRAKIATHQAFKADNLASEAAEIASKAIRQATSHFSTTYYANRATCYAFKATRRANRAIRCADRAIRHSYRVTRSAYRATRRANRATRRANRARCCANASYATIHHNKLKRHHSKVTTHTSRVIHHYSKVIHHSSRVIHHTSKATHYAINATRSASRVTCSSDSL